MKAEIVESKPLTPAEKAKETRRKNNLEKQVIAKSLKKMLKSKYKVKIYNEDTDKTEIVTITGTEMIGQRLMDIATNKDYSAKDSISAIEMIRDTIGEKPTESKKVEGKVTFAWEQMVENIKEDD